MKFHIPLVALVVSSLVVPCVAAAGNDFLSFRAVSHRQFGLPEAQALADAQRVAQHGICGMSVFKERKGALWIFVTKVGYAGVPSADIAVLPPTHALAVDAKEANQSVQRTGADDRR